MDLPVAPPPPDLLTDDVVEAFLDVARSLDQAPRAARPNPIDAAPPPGGRTGTRPGDHFNRKATWEEVLEPHGWRKARRSGGVVFWRRPGKEHGWSADTGKCSTEAQGDLLYVFSTNAAPFADRTTYSKFAAYAVLNHGGDFRAAARALGERGYGERPVVGRPAANGYHPHPHANGHAAAPAPPPPPAAEFWTHDKLLDSTFGDVRYVVDGLVADESLTILGGPQKAGKSWLSIQLAQAVAGGNPVLGKATAAGDVTYLALEDGARRLQDRLRKQRSPRGLPILWYTKFPKLDGADGWALLAELAARRPRLLIVDTLAAAKSGRTDESDAGPMADLFNGLRGLAQEHRVAVLVVHHHGKHSSGDPAHDLRGSSAIGAAADILLGLYRVRRREDGAAVQRADGFDPDDEADPDFYLKARGRDIEDTKLAVRFDSDGPSPAWAWRLADLGTHDRRKKAKASADEQMLTALRTLGGLTADQAAVALGVGVTAARVRLNDLVEKGFVSVSPMRQENGKLANVFVIQT